MQFEVQAWLVTKMYFIYIAGAKPSKATKNRAKNASFDKKYV
jgi:hypothetical protein